MTMTLDCKKLTELGWVSDQSCGGPAATVEYHGDNRPFGRPIPKPGQDSYIVDKGPGIVIETQTRPPLAGPYAFSRLPEPVDNLPKIYLKQDLPNTWLFLNTTTDSEGKSSLPVKAPDATNTSFVISAFSLDQVWSLTLTFPVHLLPIVVRNASNSTLFSEN